jgi:hypothetical protein
VVNDRAIIAIDNINTSIVDDINTKNLTLKMANEIFDNSKASHTLDIIVDNMAIVGLTMALIMSTIVKEKDWTEESLLTIKFITRA